jgi:hypothetical protein
MDQNEIIALSIVALAILLVARYFLKQKDGGCCGSGCLPKFKKEDKVSKLEDKK